MSRSRTVGFGTMLGIPGFFLGATLVGRAQVRSNTLTPASTQIRWATHLVGASLLAFLGTMVATYHGELGPDVPVGVPNRLFSPRWQPG